MADLDLISAFEGLTLGLPLQTLRLEGGNVIIRLSSRFEDTLVLHQEVLGAASERYGMRFNSTRWTPSREVRDENTGTTISVCEYLLVLVERTFTLTDDESLPVALVELWQMLTHVQKDKSTSDELTPAAEANGRDFPSRRGRGGNIRGRGGGGRGGRGGPGGRRARGADWDDRSPSPEDANHYGKPFQRSDLVQSFGIRDDLVGRVPLPVLHKRSILHHKMLFNLLYGQDLDFEFMSDSEALFTLTEVTALAEYYLLLPAVAERIDEYFVAMPGVWKDICDHPAYYIVIGSKLRSYDIYTDAMRHYVGRELFEHEATGSGSFFDALGSEPVLRLLAARFYNKLRNDTHRLTRDLRDLALSDYQAHASAPMRRNRGPEVKTTWFAQSFAKKSFADKCRWIAASSYREKLDQLMFGAPHWSHIEYIRMGKKGGEVKAGSLFVACEAILQANDSPQARDLFGKKAAGRFASIFELERTANVHPAKLIGTELRRLVRSAAHTMDYGTSPKPRVRYYEGIEYFTNIHIHHRNDTPWGAGGKVFYDEHGELTSPWEGFKHEVEVKPASDEWLQTVSVV